VSLPISRPGPSSMVRFGFFRKVASGGVFRCSSPGIGRATIGRPRGPVNQSRAPSRAIPAKRRRGGRIPRRGDAAPIRGRAGHRGASARRPSLRASVANAGTTPGRQCRHCLLASPTSMSTRTRTAPCGCDRMAGSKHH
jgi:hypothetical protein